MPTALAKFQPALLLPPPCWTLPSLASACHIDAKDMSMPSKHHISTDFMIYEQRFLRCNIHSLPFNSLPFVRFDSARSRCCLVGTGNKRSCKGLGAIAIIVAFSLQKSIIISESNVGHCARPDLHVARHDLRALARAPVAVWEVQHI